MKCIIIDDEPIARKGMKRLVDSRHELELLASLDCAEKDYVIIHGDDRRVITRMTVKGIGEVLPD